MPSPAGSHSRLCCREDIVTEEEAKLWQQLSSMEGTVRSFSGGHFYIQNHWRELAAHLTHTLFPAA